MKKLFVVLLITAVTCAHAQICDDNHQTIGVSYILTKGAAADYCAFFDNGLTAGLGIAYSAGVSGDQAETRQGQNGNSLDLFAYGGYRVWRSEYFVSVYVNAGITIGSTAPMMPLASVKVLFPMNNKAISIEPFYILDRQFTGRVTIYFQL